MGSRLPVDWQPSGDAAAWCRSLGVDPVAVAEDIVDYWAPKPEKRVDWNRTFRKRVQDLLAAGKAPMLETTAVRHANGHGHTNGTSVRRPPDAVLPVMDPDAVPMPPEVAEQLAAIARKADDMLAKPSVLPVLPGVNVFVQPRKR